LVVDVVVALENYFQVILAVQAAAVKTIILVALQFLVKVMLEVLAVLVVVTLAVAVVLVALVLTVHQLETLQEMVVLELMHNLSGHLQLELE
jgi:hypothetical protein